MADTDGVPGSEAVERPGRRGGVRPTFGSLFAGIGGIDLGLERAGWECRWQVEWNDWCQRVLAKHWPDVPRYGDVRTFTGAERVDLIAGGFPCQPFSVAGARRGMEDDRWLWPDFARVIPPTTGDTSPSWDHRASPGYVRKKPVPNLAARWPTPTSRDHKDTGDSIVNGTVPVNGLLGRAVGPSTIGGALNPTWVEWLMGFPLGWTDLGDLGTRSSRKSSR